MPTEDNALSCKKLHILKNLDKNFPILRFILHMHTGQRFTNITSTPRQNDHHLICILMAFTLFVTTKSLSGVLPIGKPFVEKHQMICVCLEFPLFLHLCANVTKSSIYRLTIVQPFPPVKPCWLELSCFFPKERFGKLRFLGW